MSAQMQFGEFCEDYGYLDELDEIEEAIVEMDPVPYWQKSLELVNAWAKYQSVKKLYINATHEETRHKVMNVVANYYGGSVQRVQNYEKELSLKVGRILAEHTTACEVYHVESVSLDWLYYSLKNGKDYNSYRKKVERRLKKAKPAETLRSL